MIDFKLNRTKFVDGFVKIFFSSDNALLKVTIPSIKNKESSEKFLSLLQNMFDLKVCSRKSTIFPVLYDVNHT